VDDYRGGVASADDLPAPSCVAAVAALGDDVRRRLYAFVRAARRPVSREEAAAHAGISRKLAAFHLDKLVDVGLLHATDAVPARRVGRRPKVYAPVDTAVAVSVPARRHEELAEILVDGLRAGTGADGVLAAATRRGLDLGATERERVRPGRLGAERALGLVAEALRRYGFEPHRDGAGGLRLRNCPFQPLAARAPELVCRVNHALLSGLLNGLQASALTANLVPTPGECCVQVVSA
jgi:predicted ArsR family transcriptional regulator